jgi:hypothetical protein
MNWAFFLVYAIEVYIPFGPDMFKPNQLTFSGYNQNEIASLASNLADSEYRI